MDIKVFIKKQQNGLRIALTLMSAVMLIACSGLGPVERDFGKSVRGMEHSQIYNMNAAENPSHDAPVGIDGNKSLTDLENLERPVTAEKEMLNYIKAKKFEIGD